MNKSNSVNIYIFLYKIVHTFEKTLCTQYASAAALEALGVAQQILVIDAPKLGGSGAGV